MQVQHVDLVTEVVEIPLEALAAPAHDAAAQAALSKLPSMSRHASHAAATAHLVLDAEAQTPRMSRLASTSAALPDGGAPMPSLDTLAEGLANRVALHELAADPGSLFMLTVDAPHAAAAAHVTPLATASHDGASSAAAPAAPPSGTAAGTPSTAQLRTSMGRRPSFGSELPSIKLEPSHDLALAAAASSAAAAAAAPPQTYVFALPPVLEDNPDAAGTAAAMADPMREFVDAPSFHGGYRSRSGLRSGSGMGSKASNALELPTPIDGDDITAPLAAASHRSSMCAPGRDL